MALKNGRQSSSLQTILVGSIIPAGTIAPFGGGVVPDGWMLCNGSSVSRATYSALFAAISTSYGSGDGSTTFTLPNAQGVFLRGNDNGRGLDSGRTLGSYQADDNKLHGHAYQAASGYGNWGANDGGFTRYSSLGTYGPYTGSPTVNVGQQIGGSGGGESRPKNITVNYIIKL
jgi:microcystin-dependent protein